MTSDEKLREIMLGPDKPFVTKKVHDYTVNVARAFAKWALEEAEEIVTQVTYKENMIADIRALAAKLDGGEK